MQEIHITQKQVAHLELLGAELPLAVQEVVEVEAAVEVAAEAVAVVVEAVEAESLVVAFQILVGLYQICIMTLRNYSCNIF